MKNQILAVPHSMVVRCDECGHVFYKNPPFRTTHCVACKPVSPKELRHLMSYQGAKIVSNIKGVSSMVG